MARRRPPFEGSFREELYNRYCQVAEQYAATPNPHLFWTLLRLEDYPLSWGGFVYHWKELQIDGLIRVDPGTGIVTICGSRLDIPEEAPMPRPRQRRFFTE